MSKLTVEVTAYKCRIELSIEQFEKLEEIDYLDIVMPQLGKLGAYDIEYSGHFGAAIFFTVETMKEAKQVTKKIESMLK